MALVSKKHLSMVIQSLQSVFNKKLKDSKADWSQNDSSADDYVKNRTHWEERKYQKTSLLDSIEHEFVSLGFEDALYLDSLGLVEGQTYTVSWDGKLYDCVAYIAEAPGTPSLGNDMVGEAGGTGGNGEPFFITDFEGCFIFAGEVGIHTVEVTFVEDTTIIHKLDKKYLPDGISSKPDWNQTDETAPDYIKNKTHYSENLYGVILSNTVETNAWGDPWACFDIETTFVPEIGNEYTVIWDGDSYTVTCFEEEGGRFLGDEAAGYGNLLDLPFQLFFHYNGTMTVVASSEGTHTYEVLGTKEIVHKLDAKYLPDDAANISDVNNLQSEISNSLDNLDSRKMNVDNPIGTGSFSMNSAANYVAGDYSSTLGNLNKAYGECSHADGMGTVASKDAQTTEGKYNIVEPKYYEVHTENNYINGKQYAYVSTEYTFDVATGIYTLVSPRNVKIQNLGVGFYVCLSGQQGNVIYYRKTKMSTTEGSNVFIYVDTYASASLENEDIYAHIVGNGVSDTSRSNAHTLDWEGNAWFAGDVYVGSTSGTNRDEGSKKLATEEYVDNKFTALDNALAEAIGSGVVS